MNTKKDTQKSDLPVKVIKKDKDFFLLEYRKHVIFLLIKVSNFKKIVLSVKQIIDQ